MKKTEKEDKRYSWETPAGGRGVRARQESATSTFKEL